MRVVKVETKERGNSKEVGRYEKGLERARMRGEGVGESRVCDDPSRRSLQMPQWTLYTFNSPIDNLPEVGSIRIGPP